MRIEKGINVIYLLYSHILENIETHLQMVITTIGSQPDMIQAPRTSHPYYIYTAHLRTLAPEADISGRDKQRVLMHGHQGWNARHGLCHIYMIYVYIWVVYSFCLFCRLFIIVTTQFVALYKPKPKPSTYDPPPPWQRSKDRYLDRSQSNKYAINMQIQTISVSK